MCSFDEHRYICIVSGLAGRTKLLVTLAEPRARIRNGRGGQGKSVSIQEHVKGPASRRQGFHNGGTRTKAFDCIANNALIRTVSWRSDRAPGRLSENATSDASVQNKLKLELLLVEAVLRQCLWPTAPCPQPMVHPVQMHPQYLIAIPLHPLPRHGPQLKRVPCPV